jgi:hypothetical protein
MRSRPAFQLQLLFQYILSNGISTPTYWELIMEAFEKLDSIEAWLVCPELIVGLDSNGALI